LQSTDFEVHELLFRLGFGDFYDRVKNAAPQFADLVFERLLVNGAFRYLVITDPSMSALENVLVLFLSRSKHIIISVYTKLPI